MSTALLIAWLPFLLIPLSVWLVVQYKLRHRAAPADDSGATCGACGYGLRGVASFTCPECGADLREVGMIPPSRQFDPADIRKRMFLFLLTGLAGLFVILNLT